MGAGRSGLAYVDRGGISDPRSSSGSQAGQALLNRRRLSLSGPRPSASLFVVGNLGNPGELRSCETGEVVARLPTSIKSVSFGRQSENASIMVCASDYAHEIWCIHPSLQRLTTLGLGVRQIDLLSDQRAVAVYDDGNAYLLDLAWLGAMGGNPASLSPDELLRTAHSGPFTRSLFDELTLVPYLDGRPPLAIR